MKRFIGALAGVALFGASFAGVAQAATPTTTTGAATAITTSSAVLHGHLNPHGVASVYQFQYGPTSAYGGSTVPRSAGSGTKRLAVSQKVTGLQPGTVYHYRILVTSPSGQVGGTDHTFKTGGAPPAGAVTGPAVNVGKTVATPTGSVNPNGPASRWYIQYGLSANYGVQTAVQGPIPAGFAPVPVSLQLAGLAPATLFHYRIVAYHAGTVSYGADATFFTKPDHAPSPDMKTKTAPGSDTRAPFNFTTSGTLKGGTYIPAAQRCTGTVGIRYFNGKRQLAYTVANVAPNCTFAGKVSFKKTHSNGSVRLRVSVFYRGNGYLASQSKIDHPRAGKTRH